MMLYFRRQRAVPAAATAAEVGVVSLSLPCHMPHLLLRILTLAHFETIARKAGPF